MIDRCLKENWLWQSALKSITAHEQGTAWRAHLVCSGVRSGMARFQRTAPPQEVESPEHGSAAYTACDKSDDEFSQSKKKKKKKKKKCVWTVKTFLTVLNLIQNVKHNFLKLHINRFNVIVSLL